MMHILIAPNAFKNSLTAEAAAEAIHDGLRESTLACTTACFPIADGGDGTAILLLKRLKGKHVPVKVYDPLGRLVDTSFGLADNGKTAIIEMADASGLRLLAPVDLDPMRATSFGTGQMIKEALDSGVSKIVIAMGGSATVDGGLGILSALGLRFIDDDGRLIEAPADLIRLAHVDAAGLDTRITACEIIVLCDVDNRLLGAEGAAAVFGPQKGANPAAVEMLDQGLRRLSEITMKKYGKDMASIKYGGAAGGASAGVYAYLNARLVNGIDYFLDISGFDAALKQANLVITGEGRIDDQTLQGKGPFGVAKRALEKGIPVIAFAGQIPLELNAELSKYFQVLLSIGNGPADLSTSIKQTRENLIRVSKQTGALLALKD